MRKMGAALMVSVVLLAGPATAAMFDEGYKPCGDRANTIAIVDCVVAKTKVWDQRLNASYAALQKVVDDGQREPLKKAQRSWLQFRDANCGFYGAAEGTIRQINAAECMRSMTEARALEFEQAAKP